MRRWGGRRQNTASFLKRVHPIAPDTSPSTKPQATAYTTLLYSRTRHKTKQQLPGKPKSRLQDPGRVGGRKDRLAGFQGFALGKWSAAFTPFSRHTCPKQPNYCTGAIHLSFAGRAPRRLLLVRMPGRRAATCTICRFVGVYTKGGARVPPLGGYFHKHPRTAPRLAS